MIDMENKFDSQNKMKKKQSISLVIPIYNALDDVKMCLNSIVENFDFEFGNVVLVNDKSQEETSAYLNEFVSSGVTATPFFFAHSTAIFCHIPMELTSVPSKSKIAALKSTTTPHPLKKRRLWLKSN